MKKLITPLLLLLLSFSGKLTPQTSQKLIQENPATKNHIFDTVRDRYGNKFLLRDITLSSPEPFKKADSQTTTGGGKPLGSSASIVNVPSQMCSAGRFDLYFAPNSFFDNNLQARTTA